MKLRQCNALLTIDKRKELLEVTKKNILNPNSNPISKINNLFLNVLVKMADTITEKI